MIAGMVADFLYAPGWLCLGYDGLLLFSCLVPVPTLMYRASDAMNSSVCILPTVTIILYVHGTIIQYLMHHKGLQLPIWGAQFVLNMVS